MTPSSNCAVSKSHVIVLLSHLMVQFFFSLANDGSVVTLGNTNITCDCTFVTFGSSIILFLTFYGTSLTLHSTNITCCTFLDPLNTNRLTNYLAK